MYAVDGSIDINNTNPFLKNITQTNDLFKGSTGCALAQFDPTNGYGVANLVCLACKPKYTPVRTVNTPDTTKHYDVELCTEIQYCDDNPSSGPWLNGCYDCIHFYDVYANIATVPLLIDFTKCV